MSDPISTGLTPGLVSTIIPVFNRAKLLRQAVESVLAQDYRPIEIIIVNDGSTDSTAQVADRLAFNHPSEIRVLHQANTGPGTARQRGLERARGEFVQFLDSDDLLLCHKFSRQVALLKEQPDCHICYGISHDQDFTTLTLSNSQPSKGTGQPHTSLFPLLLVERWWSTHTPLYRHQILRSIGPWQPWINEEDWEYEARLGALGVRLGWLPESVSITRRSYAEDHLSHDGSSNPRKLHYRALARWSIYRSALEAGLSHEIPEMRHFARAAFLLSRQCGLARLPDEARSLFQLAHKAGCRDPQLRRDLRLYRLLVALCRWRHAARISEQLRQWRQALSVG